MTDLFQQRELVPGFDSVVVKRRVMSVCAAQSLRVSALLLAVSCLVGTASAQVTGPPGIVVSKVKLDPPTTGQRILAYVAPGALTNADPSTQLSLRNVTLDDTCTQVSFNPQRGSYVEVRGGGGDLIELHAENGGSIAVASLGYAPDPPDDLRPDIDKAFVTASFNGGNFSVTFNDGGTGRPIILEDSFPVEVELYLHGQSTPISTHSATSSTDNFVVSIPAGSLDRAVLLLTDDCGNRSEIHYSVGSGTPTASGTHAASQTQASTELTGGETYRGKKIKRKLKRWKVCITAAPRSSEHPGDRLAPEQA